MCVCPEKPLSVMWSFLSGGRWSWVKTARWNSYFFLFIFNLTHGFWTESIFWIIIHTMHQGKVLVLNGLFSLNQMHKSCLRQSAMSEVWKKCGMNTPQLCPSLNNSYWQDGHHFSQRAKICWVIQWKKFLFCLLIWLNSAKLLLSAFRVSTMRSSCESVIKEIMLLGCSISLSTLQWLFHTSQSWHVAV